MKTEENPYAVPQVPVLTKADPSVDALWHVSEGVLHVRDGASLPEVCLSGASSGEPGERKTLGVDWCPAWARYLPSGAYLALLIWVVIQSGPWATAPDYSGFIVVLVAMALPMELVRKATKRGRLHVFKSDRAKRNESRRWWIEGLTVATIILGGGVLLSRVFPGFLAKGGLVFMIGTPTSIIGILEQRYRVRACEFQSGWFVLANVHPAAIARLAEIQSRLGEPRLSRKPS